MTDAIEGGLQGLAAMLLGPIEEADRLVGEAIDKAGEGLQLVGAEAEELAAKVEALAGKIDQLRQRLRGGSGA